MNWRRYCTTSTLHLTLAYCTVSSSHTHTPAAAADDDDECSRLEFSVLTRNLECVTTGTQPQPFQHRPNVVLEE